LVRTVYLTNQLVKLNSKLYFPVQTIKIDKLVKSRIPMATKKDPNSRRANPE
jgi:hypothetical protein